MYSSSNDVLIVAHNSQLKKELPMSQIRPPYFTQTLNAQSEMLNRAILTILAHHQGRDCPIPRSRLVSLLLLYRVSERQVRHQIKELRRQGWLIGSAPGEDGGYYLILDLDEFNHFMATEYLAKIKDMTETVAAMNRAALDRFGLDLNQPRLF